jgi:hypothetical protein
MKTESFYMVSIGNCFYMKNEHFVKINKNQAIGNNGILKAIPLSQYVTLPDQKDRVMCA